MKTAQIVIIEDNPGDVLLVELALKENGITHELTRFRNGQDALSALCAPPSAETPTFIPDAILLDLNTPRSDGFQVLIALKQSPRLARVPMAILTSSPAMSDRHRSGQQGTRYIQKPVQLEEFLATVGQAVREMLAEKSGAEEFLQEILP